MEFDKKKDSMASPAGPTPEHTDVLDEFFGAATTVPNLGGAPI